VALRVAPILAKISAGTGPSRTGVDDRHSRVFVASTDVLSLTRRNSIADGVNLVFYIKLQGIWCRPSRETLSLGYTCSDAYEAGCPPPAAVHPVTRPVMLVRRTPNVDWLRARRLNPTSA